MITKLIWGATLGVIAGAAYVGYRRGLFERENMREGLDRVREGLDQIKRSAQDHLHMASSRADEELHNIADSAYSQAVQARNRVEGAADIR